MKRILQIIIGVLLILSVFQTLTMRQVEKMVFFSDVYCTLSTPDGRKWAGTSNGLYYQEYDHPYKYRALPSITLHPFPSVYALAHDAKRNRLWIGAWDNIYLFNLKSQEFEPIGDTLLNMTVALKVLDNGELEAQTHGGLYHLALNDTTGKAEVRRLSSYYYHKPVPTGLDINIVSNRPAKGLYYSKIMCILLWLTTIGTIVAYVWVLRRQPQATKYFVSTDEAELKEVDFMEKAAQVVDANMFNPDFSIDKFAQEMAVSRAQLFRKLKKAGNLTAMAFITERRLLYAANLIAEGKVPVSEVYIKAGFSDASNFRRAFLRRYGVSPAEYARRIVKKDGAPTAADTKPMA